MEVAFDMAEAGAMSHLRRLHDHMVAAYRLVLVHDQVGDGQLSADARHVVGGVRASGLP